MNEQVYQISPLQAWLFIGAGFALMVGFMVIWNGKTKYKKPGKKGRKSKYYTQGEIWAAEIFKRVLPGVPEEVTRRGVKNRRQLP